MLLNRFLDPFPECSRDANLPALAITSDHAPLRGSDHGRGGVGMSAAGVPEVPGESETLLRDYNLRHAASQAFAQVSPIVGLYGIFAVGLMTVGPSFWWGLLIGFIGQLLVALTYGQLASRWALEGSMFQWSRKLLGGTYGWAAGWGYIWVLSLAMATVAYGGAEFVERVIGVEPTTLRTALIAFGMIVLATAASTHGRRIVKSVVGLCIAAEIIGSVGLGVWLLLFHRENSLSILTESISTPSGGGLFAAPLVLATAYAGWTYQGFESAGSIAEEVRDPHRAVPRAMVFGLAGVAAVVMFASLAVILAIPEIGAVTRGDFGDPIVHTLETQLGAVGTKALLVVFVIGFFATLLALQTACSRTVWALARDRQLPGSAWLSRLSGDDRLPTHAIAVTFVTASLVLPLSGTGIYVSLVTFTSGGFFLVFLMPVLGLAVARITGRWKPGTFLAGPLGTVISWAALVWLVFETVNIVWPRGDAWSQRYAFFVVFAVLFVAGVVVRWLAVRGTRVADASAVSPAHAFENHEPASVRPASREITP
jgi:amino acid transporter